MPVKTNEVSTEEFEKQDLFEGETAKKSMKLQHEVTDAMLHEEFGIGVSTEGYRDSDFIDGDTKITLCCCCSSGSASI